MKVIVVGCTHAGTASVVNLKANYPESEITVYEKNNNISFLSCGIALNVGQVIKDTENLFYNSPEKLNELGVVTKMEHEVLDIDFDNKVINVKNLISGETFEDNYDKLVLTLGSWPIVPKFEGGNLDNILLCKNYNHAKEIIEKSENAKNVVVIGAGIMGAFHIQLAKLKGARVIVCEVDDKRLDIAKNLGADIAINSKNENAVERILELTEGRGADAVFCTVASTKVAGDSIAMTGKLGRTIMYSSFHPDLPIDLSVNRVHYNEMVITGSVNPKNEDFLAATRLISHKLIDVSSLISEVIDSENIDLAFERAVDPSTYRVIVKY